MTTAYLYLLAGAALLGAITAGFVFAQGPSRRETRLGSLIPLCVAWWALCEFQWNSAQELETVRYWMRASCLGWLAIGPLGAHYVLRILDNEQAPSLEYWRGLLRRVVVGSYAAAVIAGVATILTHWVLSEPYRTAWGWSYRPGAPLLLSYVLSTAATVVALCAVGHVFGQRRSESQSHQQPWIWAAMVVPMGFVGTTEILLPALDIPFPRLGTISFGALGLITMWMTAHFGSGVLSLVVYSNEILETLREGVALLSPEGRIRRANAGLCRISGYSERELLEMPIARLLGPGFTLLADGNDEMQGQLSTASGVLVPITVKTSPLLDRQSRPVGIVIVLHDMRELEEIRDQMLTQVRLAATGELAAGIAHEINNPISFVRANLSLLAEHWQTIHNESPGEERTPELREVLQEGFELLDESQEGISRATEIIRGVKTLTSVGRQELQSCNMTELFDRSIAMVTNTLEEHGVRVERNDGELPLVPCSPHEIEQVMMNLLINAAHASGESGTIRLGCHAEPDRISISVEDDGHGIPEDIAERIFDPFFTTKRPGEGTGLGLGIAYQIVRRHGGAITVDSKPGQGASFHIHLPLGSEVATEAVHPKT